jgi:hypothetical protein
MKLLIMQVGFEVFTVVIMKSIIFWVMTLCSPLLACWLLAELISSTLKMEAICPPKRRLKLNGLHGVISQKMILFSSLFSFILRRKRSKFNNIHLAVLY